MTGSATLAGALLLCLLLGVAAVLLHRKIQQDTRLAERLAAIRPGDGAAARANAAGGTLRGVTSVVVGLGSMVAGSGLLSRPTMEQMQALLGSAGFRSAGALGMFIGVKLVLLAGMPVLAWLLLPALDLSPLMNDLGIAGSAIVGLLSPDWWVGHHRSTYRRAVSTGLPDALDMLVICTEAGLGLEPALQRVGQELRHAHPEIAAELVRTVVELRVVPDARVALIDMGERSGLPALKRVASTLAQTMQYGTPLGQALRVLAAEMRNERMLEFEARAARLPVLLTLPMIVFILPCVFLVIGGPAVVQVMHVFSNQ
jgi:tight adherence protein C